MVQQSATETLSPVSPLGGGEPPQCVRSKTPFSSVRVDKLSDETAADQTREAPAVRDGRARLTLLWEWPGEERRGRAPRFPERSESDITDRVDGLRHAAKDFDNH